VAASRLVVEGEGICRVNRLFLLQMRLFLQLAAGQPLKKPKIGHLPDRRRPTAVPDRALPGGSGGLPPLGSGPVFCRKTPLLAGWTTAGCAFRTRAGLSKAPPGIPGFAKSASKPAFLRLPYRKSPSAFLGLLSVQWGIWYNYPTLIFQKGGRRWRKWNS